MIYELNGKKPECHGDHWIAGSADVIGNVVLGDQVSIWFNAVLRGDNDPIIEHTRWFSFAHGYWVSFDYRGWRDCGSQSNVTWMFYWKK